MKKCTMCGKVFDFYDENADLCFHKDIGYGSIHDGDTLQLNLCCDCFDRTIDVITRMCIKSPIQDGDCNESN